MNPPSEHMPFLFYFLGGWILEDSIDLTLSEEVVQFFQTETV